MSAHHFDQELSSIPEQMAREVLAQKYRRCRMVGAPCLRCGHRPSESGTGLCGVCEGTVPGWRRYRPDRQGDPPYYGASWVPLDAIPDHKVGAW